MRRAVKSARPPGRCRDHADHGARVAGQRTSAVRVIRTPLKACIAPRLGPSVSLAGVRRRVSKLHRPWPGGGAPARANSSSSPKGRRDYGRASLQHRGREAFTRAHRHSPFARCWPLRAAGRPTRRARRRVRGGSSRAGSAHRASCSVEEARWAAPMVINPASSRSSSTTLRSSGKLPLKPCAIRSSCRSVRPDTHTHGDPSTMPPS